MRYCILLFLLTVSHLPAAAQYKMSTREYIALYSQVAIQKMAEYKIPASITVAQGILESGNGGSRLAVDANNHFGIKCGGKWTGARIYHDDDSRGECFRKYRSADDSYRDHSLFLTQNQRYAGLFSLNIMDYKAWAKGLKAAGYATNPKYAQILIDLIDRYELWRFDQQGATIAKRKPDGLMGLLREAKQKKEQQSDAPIRTSLSRQFVNSVPYVLADGGDTFETISARTGVSVKRLMQFNDLTTTTPLAKNTALYLKKKKGRSHVNYMHQAEQGETMHSVSQRYGIRLKSLVKMNPRYVHAKLDKGAYLRLR